MEAAIHSIIALNPEYDFKSVDVVGCGSTLGNLLRFASSSSKPFRFDVDLIGDTVFFIRRETTPTEVLTGLRGYGHTFPESYTTWDAEVRNSCSHQRIVHYAFGGLSFLIRSETDAYLKDLSKDELSKKAKSEDSGPLAQAMSSISITKKMPSNDQVLKVRMQGTRVPQDLIFE